MAVACPVRTHLPHSRFEETHPEEQHPEIRAYKLGKKRWSYNQVELMLGELAGSRTATIRQAAHSAAHGFADAHQNSAVCYNIQLASGQKLQAHIYICYDLTPTEVIEDISAAATGAAAAEAAGPAAEGSSRQDAAAVLPAATQQRRYVWQLVTRNDCCKGCQGPVLRCIQRFGRLGKRSWGDEEGGDAQAASSNSMKDPKFMYLSLDEACTHVDATAFRLVAGIYDDTSAQLLASAVSPPVRVLANNDVPTGAARIPLEAALPADWEGWTVAVASPPAPNSQPASPARPRRTSRSAQRHRRQLSPQFAAAEGEAAGANQRGSSASSVPITGTKPEPGTEEEEETDDEAKPQQQKQQRQAGEGGKPSRGSPAKRQCSPRASPAAAAASATKPEPPSKVLLLSQAAWQVQHNQNNEPGCPQAAVQQQKAQQMAEQKQAQQAQQLGSSSGLPASTAFLLGGPGAASGGTSGSTARQDISSKSLMPIPTSLADWQLPPPQPLSPCANANAFQAYPAAPTGQDPPKQSGTEWMQYGSQPLLASSGGGAGAGGGAYGGSSGGFAGGSSTADLTRHQQCLGLGMGLLDGGGSNAFYGPSSLQLLPPPVQQALRSAELAGLPPTSASSASYHLGFGTSSFCVPDMMQAGPSDFLQPRPPTHLTATHFMSTIEVAPVATPTAPPLLSPSQLAGRRRMVSTQELHHPLHHQGMLPPHGATVTGGGGAAVCMASGATQLSIHGLGPLSKPGAAASAAAQTTSARQTMLLQHADVQMRAAGRAATTRAARRYGTAAGTGSAGGTGGAAALPTAYQQAHSQQRRVGDAGMLASACPPAHSADLGPALLWCDGLAGGPAGELQGGLSGNAHSLGMALFDDACELEQLRLMLPSPPPGLEPLDIASLFDDAFPSALSE